MTNRRKRKRFILRLRFGENLIGLLESFLGADIIPRSGHAPRVNRHLRIKPLDQATGLIRIVPVGDVLVDQRQHRLGVMIQRNADEGGLWLSRFFLKTDDVPIVVGLDHTVLGRLSDSRPRIHQTEPLISTFVRRNRPVPR